MAKRISKSKFRRRERALRRKLAEFSIDDGDPVFPLIFKKQRPTKRGLKRIESIIKTVKREVGRGKGAVFVRARLLTKHTSKRKKDTSESFQKSRKELSEALDKQDFEEPKMSVIIASMMKEAMHTDFYNQNRAKVELYNFLNSKKVLSLAEERQLFIVSEELREDWRRDKFRTAPRRAFGEGDF